MENLTDLCRKAIYLLGDAEGKAQDIINEARGVLYSRGYTVVGSGKRSGGTFWIEISRHKGWIIQQIGESGRGRHRILGPDSQCYATIKNKEKLSLFLSTIIEIGSRLEQEKKRAGMEKEKEEEERLQLEAERRERERQKQEAERQRILAAQLLGAEKESDQRPAKCRKCGEPFNNEEEDYCVCGKRR